MSEDRFSRDESQTVSTPKHYNLPFTLTCGYYSEKVIYINREPQISLKESQFPSCFRSIDKLALVVRRNNSSLFFKFIIIFQIDEQHKEQEYIFLYGYYCYQ